MRGPLVAALAYLAIGVSTNLFLFHLTVAMRCLDADAERLRHVRLRYQRRA